MRHSAFLTGALVATSLVACAAFALVGGALAQQMGDGDAAPVPKRLERAARIVSALEVAKAKAEAAEILEGAYIAQLENALADAKAMTKPVTVPELTDQEKEALTEELGAAGGGGDDADARRQEWADRALDSAFEDAGLSAEEETAATPIVSDWYAEFLAARGDAKRRSEIKDTRDLALKKLLGRKKAGKVINNLNALGGWGRGR